MTAERVLLLGGPFANQRVELSRTPDQILIGSVLYDLILDPETGEGLGAYAIAKREK